MTFIIGLLAGVCIACQSAVNARLRSHLGFAFLTSFVSFVVGLVFLLGLSLALDNPLWFDKATLSAVPWWAWCGGMLGTIGLTVNVLIFPKLGGVQTAVMPILGQVLMGIIIDTFGLLKSVQIAFSTSRILGIVLVLAGVFVAIVLPQRKQLAQAGEKLWFWRGVGVLGGMALATQAAVNGELGRQLGSSLSGAVVSFLVGASVLLVISLCYEKSLASLARPTKGQPFWIWGGGVLGALFILSGVYLVPLIGTGQVVMLVLSGLICGSLLVDRLGLFGVIKKTILPVQLLGVALLLSGVALIRLV
ncbi:DMT family transporter [Mannheimia sp. E30BD]|uniref:DMT family transporter n=1 Tax=Mannheimia sp. E30BD TaxID=3278708 RepID=UPI00359D6602